MPNLKKLPDETPAMLTDDDDVGGNQGFWKSIHPEHKGACGISDVCKVSSSVCDTQKVQLAQNLRLWLTPL